MSTVSVDLVDFYRGVERMYGRSMTADTGETICPYCKKNAHMEYVEGSARLVDGLSRRGEAAFQCHACGRFLIGGALHLGLQREYQGQSAYWVNIDFITNSSTPYERGGKLDGRVEYWEPISPVGREYPDLPPEVASPADEAYRSYSIGAYRATVLLARAVIEAAAKSKGITSGTLAAKIEKLAEERHVRKDVADSAHEARMIGNEVAHGDFATAQLTAEDALDVLEIMDDVLDEVYAVATRLQRRRERRAAQAAPPE